MKKHLLFMLLTVATFTAAHAFSNAQKATFMALGGYSCTETEFLTGLQSNNYVRSGPSPENTFPN